eukprot:1140572-Pelagomonas_calceolata.AAC.1
MYANLLNKLVTTRRAIENNNTPRSQVIEPASWWRGFKALLSQCVSFSSIKAGRVSSAYTIRHVAPRTTHLISYLETKTDAAAIALLPAMAQDYIKTLTLLEKVIRLLVVVLETLILSREAHTFA